MATQNGSADPSAAVAAAGGGDGPYIPAELIPDIAKHLTSLNDFFALRAGCHAYRAALPLRRDLLDAQPPASSCPTPPPLPSPSSTSSRPAAPPSRWPSSTCPSAASTASAPSSPSPVRAGVLASDGAQVVAATTTAGSSIIVTRLLTGAQARLPAPPLPHARLVLTGGYLFAAPAAAGRTDVQYCSPWSTTAQWNLASYGGEHQIQDWRILNGALYGLLPTCGLVTASSFPKDGSMDLWLLGGEDDEQVHQALQESGSGNGMLLGDCGGDLPLIFKVGTIDPAYKIFRWDAAQAMWVRTVSLRGRAMFLGFDDFAACIGPDVSGNIRGDYVYGSLPWAGGWSEYSLVDGTCKCVTAKYPGEPGVGFGRPQAWVLPSLFCKWGQSNKRNRIAHKGT